MIKRGKATPCGAVRPAPRALASAVTGLQRFGTRAAGGGGGTATASSLKLSGTSHVGSKIGLMELPLGQWWMSSIACQAA
jgi:hypothetical protein